MQNKEDLDVQVVLLEYPQPQIAQLSINQPQRHNALTHTVRMALSKHIEALTQDEQIHCIIIRGSDQVFAAGADIRDMAERTPIEMLLSEGQKLWHSLTACSKPIIAAVNGLALGGGCELAMHADLIIAGEQARFAQPEVRLGIMPGAGGTQRLTRAVGKFHAMKMLLTGCSISAKEAQAMGLVSEVVADAEVLSRAQALAQEIAALPPLAVRQIKEVVLAGMNASLDSALTLERKAFQLLFASCDQKEGMRAFLEKRKPDYRGC